MTLKYF